MTALRLSKEQLAAIESAVDLDRRMIDQWCFDQQRRRAQGIVHSDEAGRR